MARRLMVKDVSTLNNYKTYRKRHLGSWNLDPVVGDVPKNFFSAVIQPAPEETALPGLLLPS